MLATALLTTNLLILGCTGTSLETGVGVCPESVVAETFVGTNSIQECRDFTNQKYFDPSEYMLGWASYVVRCTTSNSKQTSF